jgi:hypothetical protein
LQRLTHAMAQEGVRSLEVVLWRAIRVATECINQDQSIVHTDSDDDERKHLHTPGVNQPVEQAKGRLQGGFA